MPQFFMLSRKGIRAEIPRILEQFGSGDRRALNLGHGLIRMLTQTIQRL